MKKLSDLKKVFSNQEPEGRGCGIIMGVTRLLLLEPFYTIQIQTHQTFLGGVYNLLGPLGPLGFLGTCFLYELRL